jgi:hypothetical protein
MTPGRLIGIFLLALGLLPVVVWLAGLAFSLVLGCPAAGEAAPDACKLAARGIAAQAAFLPALVPGLSGLGLILRARNPGRRRG